jgi:hypothetical protein
MNLKKILFVAMLGLFTLPSIASAKPPRDRHNVTPAMKVHLAKLRFGR